MKICIWHILMCGIFYDQVLQLQTNILRLTVKEACWVAI
jgi:hypothetical protein